MLKKLSIVIIVLAITIFTESSCSRIKNKPVLEESTYVVNEFSDASLSIIENTLSNNSVSVDIFYSGNDSAILSSWFTIEVYQNDKWYSLSPIQDNYFFNDLGYPVGTMHYDWTELYGKLSSGTYRIITNILVTSAPGNYQEYFLSDTFILE